jgi:hypothetical protein
LYDGGRSSTEASTGDGAQLCHNLSRAG